MTGPEHYKEAERLLEKLQSPPLPATTSLARTLSWDEMAVLMSGVVAQAQVHATLALAAASITENTLYVSQWVEVVRHG